MTAMTEPNGMLRLPSSTVRLARALVHDAKRRGTRESPTVEDVARTRLPEDATS
jgi:hypothetical protein